MTAKADKKLYVVHVGYYDDVVNYGVYEAHTNFFVVAASPQEAKKIAKAKPIYAAKKMHTDGVQEITAVGGYRLDFIEDASLSGGDVVENFGYDKLNPATPIGGA